MANFEYNRGPCRRCGKHISAAGFAQAAHRRKHARLDRLACASRFQAGEAGSDEIDDLPWQQAKYYLAWLGPARTKAYPELAHG